MYKNTEDTRQNILIKIMEDRFGTFRTCTFGSRTVMLAVSYLGEIVVLLLITESAHRAGMILRNAPTHVRNMHCHVERWWMDCLY